MKSKASFIKDLKIRYRIIRSTVTVMIGIFAVSAVAIAKIAEPFNASVETISPHNTVLVSESRIPDGYTDTLFRNIHNSIKERWNCELDELAILDDDWDGENSAAIQPDAVTRCRHILDETGFAIENLSELYPTPFGSICMEWSVGNGYVNAEVASTGIAFFHNYGNNSEKYICEFNSAFDETINILKNHLS